MKNNGNGSHTCEANASDHKGQPDDNPNVQPEPSAQELAEVLGELVSPAELEARALHDKISSEIEAVKAAANRSLALFFQLACSLVLMQEGKGYQAMGFRTWTEYVGSLPEGGTYVSYVLKAGKAGDLSRFIAQGMGKGILFEFVKACPRAEKIPQLIEAIQEDVAGLSCREARTKIEAHVLANPAEYGHRRKHERKTRSPAPAATEMPEATELPQGEHGTASYLTLPTTKREIIALYLKMTPTERTSYHEALKAAVAELEDMVS